MKNFLKGPVMAMLLATSTLAQTPAETAEGVRIFERQTGMSVSALVAGTNFQVGDVIISDPSAPWLVKIDQTHGADGVSDPNSATIRSQINIERLLTNAGQNGDKPSVYAEDISEGTKAFTEAVLATCRGKMSVQELMNSYEDRPILRAIAAYISSKKGTSGSDNNGLLAIGAADWKLACDGKINLLPAELRAQHAKASFALNEIVATRKQLLVDLQAMAEKLSDRAYNDYLADTKKPRRKSEEGSQAVDFELLAENVRNQEVKNLILTATAKIRQLEAPILLERELAALSQVAKGTEKVRFLVYGRAHDFRRALAATSKKINYIRLG